MDIYQADIQLAVAKYLRWMPDRITIEAETLSMEGWVIGLWNTQDQYRFLMNGVDFDVVEWPLPSPDLKQCFPDIPMSETSRFRCRHYFSDYTTLFPEGMAHFNVTNQFGEHPWSYRTAWFLADPTLERPLPSLHQVEKAIGVPDRNAFCWGGATIVARFNHLLTERFGRPISSFASILDWGCGAGRLMRYLLTYGSSVTGVDIDLSNVRVCKETLPKANCMQVPLLPPTTIAPASFDLVVGLSVLPHLAEQVQDAWLAELQRITRPNALLLLSVRGLSQMALYKTPVDLNKEAHRKGFYDMGSNVMLRPFIDDNTYYRDVLHTPDYILSHWSRYFDVLDIIEAIAGNQDVVVLRRRTICE